MNKVIFVEILHHPGLINTVSLLGNSFSRWESVIITTDELYSKIDSNQMKNSCIKVHLINMKKCKSIKKNILFYVKKLKDMWRASHEVIQIISYENPNAVIFNTLDLPLYILPIYLYILRRGSNDNTKICTIVHNTHAWELKGICTEFMLGNRGIKDILKIISKVIFNNLIIKKIDGVITLSNYLRLPKKIMNLNKHVMPYKVNCFKELGTSCIRDNNIIRFVVPGFVDTARKDYHSLLKGIKKLLNNNRDLKYKIEIVFLGKLLDEEVLKQIQDLELAKNIIYFEKFISEEDFNNFMLNSHYAIIPMYDKSLYGNYKISGAFDDALIAGIPILIPEKFSKDHVFQSNVIRFSWKSLDSTLLNLANIANSNDDKYKEMLSIAKKAAKTNDLKINSEYLENFLNTLTI